MLEGLYSAAAGMAAQQEQLNAISNDLANVSTTGYKSERVAFSDLLYNTVDMAGTDTTDRRRRERAGDRPQRSAGIDPAKPATRWTWRSKATATSQVTRGERQSRADARRQPSASTRAARSSTPRATALVPPIKLPAGVSPSEVQHRPRRHRHRGHANARADQARDRHLARTPARQRQRRAHADGRQRRAARGHQARDPPGRAGGLERRTSASDMAMMVSTQRNYQLTSTAIQTESQMMSIANQLRTQ